MILLTFAEAADECKVSRRTIRDWVQHERIPVYDVGDGLRRVARHEVFAEVNRPRRRGGRPFAWHS